MVEADNVVVAVVIVGSVVVVALLVVADHIKITCGEFLFI